jgi:hypothetical protein
MGKENKYLTNDVPHYFGEVVKTAYIKDSWRVMKKVSISTFVEVS